MLSTQSLRALALLLCLLASGCRPLTGDDNCRELKEGGACRTDADCTLVACAFGSGGPGGCSDFVAIARTELGKNPCIVEQGAPWPDECEPILGGECPAIALPPKKATCVSNGGVGRCVTAELPFE